MVYDDELVWSTSGFRVSPAAFPPAFPPVLEDMVGHDPVAASHWSFSSALNDFSFSFSRYLGEEAGRQKTEKRRKEKYGERQRGEIGNRK